MPWHVRLSKRATQAYLRLPPPDRKLQRALDALEHDPRPAGKHVKAIRGTKDAFLRYRVGDYRILYEVLDASAVVLVQGIVHRKDLEDWLRRQG